MTTELVRTYRHICMEDTRIRNMTGRPRGPWRNPGPTSGRSRSEPEILSQGWYGIRRKLEYKCAWNERTFTRCRPRGPAPPAETAVIRRKPTAQPGRGSSAEGATSKQMRTPTPQRISGAGHCPGQGRRLAGKPAMPGDWQVWTHRRTPEGSKRTPEGRVS